MDLTAEQQLETANRLMERFDAEQMGPWRISPWRGGQIIWLEDGMVMMPENTKQPLWCQGKRAEEYQGRIDEMDLTQDWHTKVQPAPEPAPEPEPVAAAPAALELPAVTVSAEGMTAAGDLLAKLAASAQLAAHAMRSGNTRLDPGTLNAWRSARIAFAQLTLEVERRAE